MTLGELKCVLFMAAVVFCSVAAPVEALGSSGSTAITPVYPGGKEIAIVQEGQDWRIVNVRGRTAEGGGRSFDQNLIVITGAGGAKIAPLPAEVRADAIRAAGAGSRTLVIDQATANEIAASLRLGRLTPALLAVAEPEDRAVNPFFGSCSNDVITKAKTVTFDFPTSLAEGDLGKGFSGSLNLDSDIRATATAEIQLQALRLSVFGFCIPYAVQFDHTRAYGDLSVGYSATLSGMVKYANPKPWEWEVAKPFLFAIDFQVGPVPVIVGFNLPITAGLELSASATGSVTFDSGRQAALGHFDYTCTFDGCSGQTGFTQSNGSVGRSLTGSVSGHIEPSIYAQAALRGFLYLESLAYAQVGVRAYLRGDFWGYYGNDCGDADGDGTPETVNALTFDLDGQLRMTAEASLLGNEKSWDDLWSTPYRHLGFWDLSLGTSKAIQPMLAAQSPVAANTSQRYEARMRSCWPYDDVVRYQLNWGDGTLAMLSGAPRDSTSASKTWPTQGQKSIALTALSDEHGRDLRGTTNRTITVAGVWTSWFNRDDPSGAGDSETLADLRAAGINVCKGAVPIGIECTTVAGVDYRSTGQVYSCTASIGGICQNALQDKKHTCLDYRVRYLCS